MEQKKLDLGAELYISTRQMGNCASVESVENLKKTVTSLGILEGSTRIKLFTTVSITEEMKTKLDALETKLNELDAKTDVIQQLTHDLQKMVESSVNPTDTYRAWLSHLVSDSFTMQLRIVNTSPTTIKEAEQWMSKTQCGCHYADYVKTINWHSPSLKYKLSNGLIVLQLREQLECHWDSTIEFVADIQLPVEWIANFSMEDVTENYTSNEQTFFTMEKMMNLDPIQTLLGTEITEPMSIGSFLASCMRTLVTWNHNIIPKQVHLEDA